MIGISVDGPEKNKAFAESLRAAYPIVSDSDRAVSRAYGVLIPILRLAGRTTFVVDRQGVIQSIYRGKEAVDPCFALAGSYFQTQV